MEEITTLTSDDIIYGEMCLESYPCKHYIQCDKLGIKGIYDGEQICYFLNQYGIDKHWNVKIKDNHFNKYINSMSPFPSPEIIARIKAKYEDDIKISEQKYKEEYKDRLIQIENMEKYTNRLERLKSKNNVIK